jgi:hypothetical protein
MAGERPARRRPAIVGAMAVSRSKSAAEGSSLRIGLVADTHGLVRPEALGALAGSDVIIHAGDIGKPEVIEALEAIAPVHAIRGNVDRDAWAEVYPETLDLELGGARIHVAHDRKALGPEVAAADVVVTGHSHKPLIERMDGTLYVNPGSAGPRRFSLPVSVARLVVDCDDIEAELLELEVPPPKRRSRNRRNEHR